MTIQTRNCRIIGLIGSLLLVACLQWGVPVAAQGARAEPPVPGFDIGIEPQIISMSGARGSTRTFDVSIRNFNTNRSSRIWLWPADTVQQPNGFVSFQEVGSYAHSSARWLKLDRDQLLLRPGETGKVRATITVPGGGIEGSYHSAIMVSGAPPPSVPIAPTQEVKPGEGAAAFAVTRVSFGVIIHFEIERTLKYDAEIESMFVTTDPPPRSGLTRATSPYKYWMVMRVRNTGNALIRGFGWANLREKGRGLVGQWRMGTKETGERRIIYPARYRDIYLPIESTLRPGEYVAQARFYYTDRRAAMAEVVLNVTQDDIREDVVVQAGPMMSLTLGLSVSVDRELEEIRVAPGGYRTGILRVTNHEDTDLLLTTEIADVRMDPDGLLVPSNPEPGVAPDVSSWLRAGPSVFTLPPGGSRRVVYTVGVPNDPELRQDIYGLVKLHARKLDVIAREAEREVVGETGMLLIVTLAGRGKLAGDLGVLRVDVRPEDPGRVRIGIPVMNTGDIHFWPTLRMEMSAADSPAPPIERVLGLSADRILVMPGIERVVWTTFDRTQLRPGEYTPRVTLDYGDPQKVTKRYRLVLQEMPGDEQDGGGGAAEGNEGDGNRENADGAD